MFPNLCSGDHKCSLSNLQVLFLKVEIINILCKKNSSKYEGFLDYVIVSCSARFKRLGNTVYFLFKKNLCYLSSGHCLFKLSAPSSWPKKSAAVANFPTVNVWNQNVRNQENAEIQMQASSYFSTFGSRSFGISGTQTKRLDFRHCVIYK